jgi:hypothetical protein
MLSYELFACFHGRLRRVAPDPHPLQAAGSGAARCHPWEPYSRQGLLLSAILAETAASLDVG